MSDRATKRERELAAIDLIKDAGIAYFNPLIGDSPEDTCSNLCDVMALWHSLHKKQVDLCGSGHEAIDMLIQLMWSAVQFEGMHIPEQVEKRGAV